VPYEKQGQRLEDFPNLQRWFHAIAERPATKAAYARAPEINPDFGKTLSEEAKKVMFGQTAATRA
jgi:GST-like protein